MDRRKIALSLISRPVLKRLLRARSHRSAEEVARTGDLLERYQRVNGKYPDSLELLVPEFLDKLSLDRSLRKVRLAMRSCRTVFGYSPTQINRAACLAGRRFNLKS
jgi:hypothetical protein